MRKITFITFLFFIFIGNIVAADFKIFGLEETPMFKRGASAGVCTFNKANPVKTGLNLTDTCGVFYRSTTGNSYAAALVYFSNPTDPLVYSQIDTIRVAANETKYFHLLIYNVSTKNITPKIFFGMPTGYTNPADLTAINLSNGELTTNNQWVDVVYSVSGGETGLKMINVQLRLDNLKAFVASNSLGNNVFLPPTTDVPEVIGTDYLYFDEFIINDDPNPRTVGTGIGDVGLKNSFNVNVSGRAINISDVSGYSKAFLYNSVGQRLDEKEFSNQCEFEVSTSGIFMVQINGKVSKVIVK